MEWFSERYQAFSNAAGPRRYVLGFVFAAAVGAIDQIEQLLCWGIEQWVGTAQQCEDQTMIFGFPSWIFGVTVAFILLFLWMLNYAVSLRRLLTPNFRVWFDPSGGGLSQTYETNTQTSEYIDDVKYVRLAVTSLSRKSVSDCVANLVRIERRDESAQTEIIWDQDALPLQWSIVGGFQASLHYACTQFVDVARVYKERGVLQLITVIPNRLASRLPSQGTLVLTVVVTGDGLSNEAKIEIETDGTFDGLKAKPN